MMDRKTSDDGSTRRAETAIGRNLISHDDRTRLGAQGLGVSGVGQRRLSSSGGSTLAFQPPSRHYGAYVAHYICIQWRARRERRHSSRRGAGTATSKVETLPVPTMPSTAEHGRRSIGASHTSAQSTARQDREHVAGRDSFEIEIYGMAGIPEDGPCRMEGEKSSAKSRWQRARAKQATEDREASAVQGAAAHSIGGAQGIDERTGAHAWTWCRSAARLSAGRTILGPTASLWGSSTQLCEAAPTQPPPGFGAPPPGSMPNAPPGYAPPAGDDGRDQRKHHHQERRHARCGGMAKHGRGHEWYKHCDGHDQSLSNRALSRNVEGERRSEGEVEEDDADAEAEDDAEADGEALEDIVRVFDDHGDGEAAGDLEDDSGPSADAEMKKGGRGTVSDHLEKNGECGGDEGPGGELNVSCPEIDV
ncbi:hypothetical protein L1887_47714 [Cichorium endivia]|nr:hypothetical protein L1887_47714 [Cichorium endivia]